MDTVDRRGETAAELTLLVMDGEGREILRAGAKNIMLAWIDPEDRAVVRNLGVPPLIGGGLIELLRMVCVSGPIAAGMAQDAARAKAGIVVPGRPALEVVRDLAGGNGSRNVR